MDFIKKNKFTIIAVVLMIILFFVCLQIKVLFFPNEGKAIYGNRLDGIEEVKIRDSKVEQILAELEEDALVDKATLEEHGRLVNITITVVDEASVEDSKGIASKAISNFDDKQKEYYDFQVIIQKQNEELLNFPIIGYKNQKSSDFVWTKDRAATAE